MTAAETGPSATTDVAEHRAQLMRGVLDMCLLALIDEQPSYGYAIVRTLQERGLPLGSEASIYPMLSRMQRQRLIESYLEESPEGPARKYYRITDEGRRRLAAWVQDWRQVAGGVESVLKGAGR